MNQTPMIPSLEEKRIVPVVKLDRVEDARPLAEALIRGGLPVAEVTFRTDAAEESIRTIKNEFPDMLVGAGTVINTEQAKRALDAGASFMVSPGTSEKLLQFAVDNAFPIFPGVCTPTEIMLALEYGLSYIALWIFMKSSMKPTRPNPNAAPIDAKNLKFSAVYCSVVNCGTARTWVMYHCSIHSRAHVKPANTLLSRPSFLKR